MNARIQAAPPQIGRPGHRLDIVQLLQALADDGLVDRQQAAEQGQYARLSSQPAQAIIALAERQLKSPLQGGRVLDLESLTRWAAGRCGLEYVHIDPLKVDFSKVAEVMSVQYASRFSILPLEVRPGEVVVAVSEPFITDWVDEISALGRRAVALQADLADEAAVRALVPACVAALGSLRCVVNNASLFEYDSAADFSIRMLDAHMHANLAAPILLAQALHQHLQNRQAQGAVVNLLDQKLWNQNPDFLSYTLSKAALEAANTMLAHALAPRLRLVGVAPGLTLTSHMLSDEKFQQLHRLSPLGRSSSSADVAATVRFALENASITGTTLLVDGGQHLMRFERDFSLM
jgi:NAD(P)-dependent dehydrogenase (short-subunit alcohol dehydrogenase family)